MSRLRVAHISDFHLRRNLPGTSTIARRQSRRMGELLAEAISDIRREDPDLVAVTGDLVDHPLYGLEEPELSAAGERDLRLVADLFAAFACPVVFLPGNHDHPSLFRRVFGGAPCDFDVRGHRILVFNDAEVECHSPQRMGGERERFLAALRDGDPRPQIHLQHYLIAPERNEGYPHTYREAASLKGALLADPRVRLVLSGHYHRGEALFREGTVCFAVAPAFAEPPHPYRLYELTEASVTQTERCLAPGRGAPKPAVFLDRDGTINPQAGYRTGPAPFTLMEGVADALLSLKRAGFVLVLVSNQTAVGHGYVTVETVGSVNDRMAALLGARGVELDGVYCRYGSPDAVVPRYRSDSPGTKPSPAMLREASEDLRIDLGASFMVGDRVSDVEAGRNAGCLASVLVRTGAGRAEEGRLSPRSASFVADDLPAAAEWILRRGLGP